MAEIIPDPPRNDDYELRMGRKFRAPSRSDRLQNGEGLLRGQKLQSASGQVELSLQQDRNFVLYVDNFARWVYRPRGSRRADTIMMQEDGNLVIEGSSNDPVWATDSYKETNGRRASLVVRDDGTAVIETQDGQIIWSTVSCG